MTENTNITNIRKRSGRYVAPESPSRWQFLWAGLGYLIMFLCLLCFFSAKWYADVYGNVGFDSILYSLTGGLGGAESGLVVSFLLRGLLPGLLTTAAVGLALFLRPKKRWGIWPVPRGIARSLAAGVTLLALLGGVLISGFPGYVMNLVKESPIYEQRYVDPAQVQITFPQEKRNLIYIFLESMETAYFSTEQGGAHETNLIPELYALAEQNTNFSHNDGVGGFRSVGGTTWTIGAMVGQTGGVPLKTPDNLEDWQNGYGAEGEFLPGLTNLSDILHAEGYYQSLMVGSVASFGGRKTYYSTHGTDKIYELRTAQTDGIVPADYFEWWGIEDKYLFEHARQELTKISQQEQPFAFTMLTVDTHHIGGYRCSECVDTYEEQYANVMSCSSRQVLQFVQWLQEQPFYDNTTVIIVGDHPSMDNGYFQRNVDENYTRRVYNCFLNSAVSTQNTKNREFTCLDLFPTTLAAMGCTIEGERLGLGTNLFSGLPTLAESMGFNSFNSQVSGNSEYYSRVFRREDPTQEGAE